MDVVLDRRANHKSTTNVTLGSSFLVKRRISECSGAHGYTNIVGSCDSSDIVLWSAERAAQRAHRAAIAATALRVVTDSPPRGVSVSTRPNREARRPILERLALRHACAPTQFAYACSMLRD